MTRERRASEFGQVPMLDLGDHGGVVPFLTHELEATGRTLFE